MSVAAPATQIVALTGTGGEAAYVNSTGNYYQGGKGGCSPFGGCGPGRMADTGIAAIANTGSGGSGAGGTTAGQSGAGGASGGYVRAIIPAPVASVSCNVGALGAGGTGTAGSDGGNGAVGTIIVKEVYQ